jgi:hypothetical protein
MYDDLLKQALEMFKHFEEHGDEFLELSARLMAKARDNLIANDFTREEAIQILAHQGCGLKSS